MALLFYAVGIKTKISY